MISCPLICITGPDGSGKSTLIGALQQELPGSRVVTIWDMMREPNLQSVIPFRSKAEVDAYLAALHHEARALFLFHCLSEALALAAAHEASCLLSDGYWFKYYATEAAHGTPLPHLDRLVVGLPKPDRVFYLEASESLTSSRKEQYSRYECGFAPEVNADSFQAFQQRSNPILAQLMDAEQPTRLNSTDSVERNRDLVLNVIQPVLS